VLIAQLQPGKDALEFHRLHRPVVIAENRNLTVMAAAAAACCCLLLLPGMMSLRYQPFGLAEPLCFVDIKASPRVRVQQYGRKTTCLMQESWHACRKAGNLQDQLLCTYLGFLRI
jgi:hypothetical protein